MSILDDKDIVFLFLKYLSIIDLVHCREVSKRWCHIISEKPYALTFWTCNSYNEFVQKAIVLKKQNETFFKWLLDETWSIEFAFNIGSVVDLDTEAFVQELTGENNLELTKIIENIFTSNLENKKHFLFAALYEKLITVKDLYEIHFFTSINCMGYILESLLTLLRNGIISVHNLDDFYFERNLHVVFSEPIFAYLVNGIVTYDDITSYPDYERLKAIKNARIALEERLVTMKQIRSQPNFRYWKYFFHTDAGINALREGTYTVQDVIDMPTSEEVYKAFLDVKRIKN